MSASSTVLSRLHLALTGLLLVALIALGGLLAAGRGPAARPSERPDAPEKKTATKPGGRYQIEPAPDMRHLIGQAGNLGFFGEHTQEVWVYRYQGGLLECSLEAETLGQTARGQTIPENWQRLLDGDESLRGPKASLRKEGYVLVAAMRPVMPVHEALVPYHVHLGGLFVSGPAGVLHQLTTVHLDSLHLRLYRVLLNAGPPQGPGFNVWTGQLVPVRLPLVPRDPAEEEFHAGGGKDLTPEEDVTILERQRGLSRVRVRARFLSDAKAGELLKKGE